MYGWETNPEVRDAKIQKKRDHAQYQKQDS
jgi:hypothetical protein